MKAAKEKLEAEKQKQMQELKLAQEQMRITGDKEMQKKLQEERAAFEKRIKAQEQALEEERKRNAQVLE